MFFFFFRKRFLYIYLETLIVWNEPQVDIDFALSFQQASGCMEIW